MTWGGTWMRSSALVKTVMYEGRDRQGRVRQGHQRGRPSTAIKYKVVEGWRTLVGGGSHTRTITRLQPHTETHTRCIRSQVSRCYRAVVRSFNNNGAAPTALDINIVDFILSSDFRFSVIIFFLVFVFLET